MTVKSKLMSMIRATSETKTAKERTRNRKGKKSRNSDNYFERRDNAEGNA